MGGRFGNPEARALDAFVSNYKMAASEGDGTKRPRL